MKRSHLIIVGFGVVMSLKYITFFNKYFNKGIIGGYSIVDLESQRNLILKKLEKFSIQPENIFFIPDQDVKGNYKNITMFKKIIKRLEQEGKKLKVYVSTEPKFHEGYLEYCIKKNIDCLVEKPVITPMKNGLFNPSAIGQKMKHLVSMSLKGSGKTSVMSSSGYHKVFYNEIYLPVKIKLESFNTPITSIHIRTSSGVWNMYNEFKNREDHPYKYGYGVLMHGAYHYIDILAQYLELNKSLFPNEKLSLTLTSFAAYPKDQSIRIPKTIYKKFDKKIDIQKEETDTLEGYGETDVTTVFCLKNDRTKQTITLGSLAFEHTTPCFRSWRDLPTDIYNKNGRLPCTDIEIQLSTLFSIQGRLLKTPGNDNSGTYNTASVSIRSNSKLLGDEMPYQIKYFKKFETTSKDELIASWLKGKEDRSVFHKHLFAMVILGKIALSIRKQGYPISFII